MSSTSPTLLDAIAAGELLLDGGIGSQLLCSGFDLERDFRGLEHCCEVLCLTRPEQVRAVHESYFDAGARAATTNTFAGSPAVLESVGLGGEARAIHRAALRAAAEAAELWGQAARPLFKLGSIGPAFPDDDGALPPAEELEPALARQVEWLAEFGADGLLFETVTDLDVLALGLAAAERRAPALPRIVTAHVDGDVVDAARLERLCELGRAHGVALLGLNCSEGPGAAAASLRWLREHHTGPLAALPNAGTPSGSGVSLSWPIDAPTFAADTAALVRELDLAAAGGCCGTGPAHIRALGLELGWIADTAAEDAAADSPPDDHAAPTEQ